MENLTNPDSESRDDVSPARARPVAPIYAARPLTPQAIALPKNYPESDMTRRAAIVDIAIAIVVLFGTLLSPYFGRLVMFIIERYPEFDMLWSNVVIGGVSIVLVAAILALRRQSPRSIGLGRPTIARVAAGLAAVPGCYVAMMLTGFLYILVDGFDAESIIEEKRVLLEVLPEFSMATVLLFGLLTGIHEELLFRGLLLTRLNAITRSRVAAIIISAVAFGFVHSYQGVMGMVQIGVIGLVMGIVATATRSIWPAIIAHGVFNSMQLALLPYAKSFLENLDPNATTLPV